MTQKKTKTEKKVEVSYTEKLGEISADVKNQTKLANSIVVADEKTELKASELLVNVKARIKKVDEWRKFFVKPLQDHVKTINAEFANVSEPLEKIENALKNGISTYRMELHRKAVAEQARIDKIRQTANEKRLEKGQDIINAPVATVETPDAPVKTQAGTVSTSLEWTYEVEDIHEVPRQFLRCEANHSEIMKAIKEGKREIKGLKIFEKVSVKGITR